MRSAPTALPYHRAIVEFLRAQEPGLWTWFASSPKRDEETEAVRLELLKSTYRLERSSQPKLYELADEVRERMHLNSSVTLYQAQSGAAVMNAALAYLPNEAHVILTGPVATVLSERELRAVLAHELAHFLLFEESGHDYLVAADLLRALASDRSSAIVAGESFRLFSLWAEIFADRWACFLTDDAGATIAALIKTETGMSEVSAESYLRQAEEIFAKSDERTDRFSHPESYIRARALRLWVEQGDDAIAEIQRMIEGGMNLNRLDLLGQRKAAGLTLRILQSLLAPRWHQTETVLAHAKRFFPDFDFGGEAKGDELKSELERCDSSVRDFICYLMLDFITVDGDLGDVALAGAIVLARQLGIDQRLAELVQKELAIGKKAYARTEKDAAAILAKTQA